MKGYLRSDGRYGIRNIVLVVYLVECAHHVADMIARHFTQDDDVHVIGFSGCAPNEYAERMMRSLCTHPNVGGVVICSLGCENFRRNELLENVLNSGRLGELIVIQEEGGTRKSIERGIESISKMLPLLHSQQHTPISLSHLCIGTVCGGSDAWSGLTANPSVGVAFDRLVSHGATCIFEEPGELIGCENMLRERGINKDVGDKLYNCIVKADKYYKQMGHDSFSQGNAVGGLTTIEEKSLGSYCKSGSSRIKGLIYPADNAINKDCQGGLYMMDVVPDGKVRWGFPNINDNAEIMEMIASGCHTVLYTTGRGSIAGSAIAPVIKVCSNPDTFKRMSEDMDINAGRILTEGATFNDIADEIIDTIKQVANGVKTCSEALGHREYHIGYKYFLS